MLTSIYNADNATSRCFAYRYRVKMLYLSRGSWIVILLKENRRQYQGKLGQERRSSLYAFPLSFLGVLK